MIFFIWVQVSFSLLHSLNRAIKIKPHGVNSSPTKLRYSEEAQSEETRLRNFRYHSIHLFQ